jgi:hypothetical protein
VNRSTPEPRYLAAEPPGFLKRPVARLQPVLAKQGRPNIDLTQLEQTIAGVGGLAPLIPISSPDHWQQVIRSLGPEIDGLLPVSIAAYPTEVWNSHPQPLMERGLPLLFWSILQYDEPDFWRWSARDFLTALGVPVHLVRNNAHGLDLLRALAMRRFLTDSRLVVFGEQNFPWNAPAAGHLVTGSLGTKIVVRPLEDIRSRYAAYSDTDVDAVWAARRGRYIEKAVRPEELRQALRTYLAIRGILEEERALGFGVNCFGDLIIKGGRDVPCLAQTLLREDGYIASCDGDYLALMSMVLTTFFLDLPSMMSNMYPVRHVGALKDHFGGDPLSPNLKKYPKTTWKNLARLAHCGFVGVISPEMDPRGRVVLNDWGGTWEIKRDGRGCGIDGALRAGEIMTAVELKFDGRTLLVARGEVQETTRHQGLPHCESTALLRFDDLEAFVEDISREHTVVLYGDHTSALKTLAGVLGLECHLY